MPRKGLGKGLDSLIPEIYDENFDSNSTQSLEDILNENEVSPKEEEKPIEKNIFEQLEDEKNAEEVDSTSSKSEDGSDEKQREEEKEELHDDDITSEDIPGDKGSEDVVQSPQEIKINDVHVDEVKEIVNKNPRITLWSARSSAVFRYLRKTEPEFSISKEASTLIDEAVSKKYPEIWELFDEF